MESIAVQEDIGIKNIREFHLFFGEVLSREDEITLDFAAVERIDLAVAQVLMAARRLAKREGKVLKLKNISEDVRKQLQITGLVK
jgi:anti-anti-sigma regulatory factor